MDVKKDLEVRPGEKKWGDEEKAMVVGPPGVWEDFQRGPVVARREQRKHGMFPKGMRQRPKRCIEALEKSSE